MDIETVTKWYGFDIHHVSEAETYKIPVAVHRYLTTLENERGVTQPDEKRKLLYTICKDLGVEL